MYTDVWQIVKEFMTQNVEIGITFCIILLILFPIESIAIPTAYSKLTNAFLESNGIVKYSLVLLGVYVILYVSRILFEFTSRKIKPAFVNFSREAILSNINDSCQRGCPALKPGIAIKNIMTNTWDIYEFLNHILTSLVPELVYLVCTVLYLFYIDSKLGFISFFTVVIIFIAAICSIYYFKEKERAIYESELYNLYDEKLNHIFVVTLSWNC